MSGKPIITMQVAVVPSWFYQAIIRARIPLEDISCFKRLYTYAENGLLDKEEVYAYIMANSRFVHMWGEVFDDFTIVNNTTDNAKFIEQHQVAIDAFGLVLKDESLVVDKPATKDNEFTSIFIASPNILNKEYYVPKVVQADTLLLIGSSEPTFKNVRAFYNAVIESVANVMYWDALKTTNLMKHYLRNAVSD